MKLALLAALAGQLNLSVHHSSSAPASTLQGGFGHSVPQALTDISPQFLCFACVANIREGHSGIELPLQLWQTAALFVFLCLQQGT